MRQKGQVAIWMIILIAVFGLVSGIIVPAMTQKDVVITVTKTDRIVERNGEDIHSKYLVYTEEETFENTDSWMFWKFNSSDVQGRLLEGNRYRVKVYGWRIPFFSSYRNIVKIKEKL